MPGLEAYDVKRFLVQPRELSAERVELGIGGDQPGVTPEVERREEADHELVRVLPERDLGFRLPKETPEPVPNLLGLGERAVPLLVDVPRRVLERLELTFARHVGPGLVRVAGQKQAIGDAERGVVGGQGVRRPPQLVELDHSSLRTDQRSGNAGLLRVVCRYGAPGEPPVPGLLPIVRSTILTCR